MTGSQNIGYGWCSTQNPQKKKTRDTPSPLIGERDSVGSSTNWHNPVLENTIAKKLLSTINKIIRGIVIIINTIFSDFFNNSLTPESFVVYVED